MCVRNFSQYWLLTAVTWARIWVSAAELIVWAVSIDLIAFVSVLAAVCSGILTACCTG